MQKSLYYNSMPKHLLKLPRVTFDNVSVFTVLSLEDLINNTNKFQKSYVCKMIPPVVCYVDD